MNFETMVFDGWADIWRTLVVGLLAYVGLIATLRISGKRTLSKMNAFDFVVTVALGSTLATILLSKDVSLVEGITAFVTLIGAQYAITWGSVRFRWLRETVKAEPTLLLHDGRLLDGALRSQRVTHDEVLAAVRAHGIRRLDNVTAVVLETDGTFTVVPSATPSSGKVTTLAPHIDVRPNGAQGSSAPN